MQEALRHGIRSQDTTAWRQTEKASWSLHPRRMEMAESSRRSQKTIPIHCNGKHSVFKHNHFLQVVRRRPGEGQFRILVSSTRAGRIRGEWTDMLMAPLQRGSGITSDVADRCLAQLVPSADLVFPQSVGRLVEGEPPDAWSSHVAAPRRNN